MFTGMTATDMTDWTSGDFISATNDGQATSFDNQADPDDDLDEPSGADEDNGSTTALSASSGGGARTARNARPTKARSQRTLVRRVAAKTLQIEKAKASQRQILSALLGVETEAVALTVAALTGASDTAVTDLFALADADPMEAGLMAAELGADKVRTKAVWSLLLAVGAVTGEPGKESAKAGLAIARAAQGLDKSVRADLTAALDLLK